MNKLLLILGLLTLSFQITKAQIFNERYERYPSSDIFTEDEWRASVSVAPIHRATLIWSEEEILRSSTGLRSASQDLPLYLLVVERDLYPYIRLNLYKYAQLVADRAGYDVQIVHVNRDASAQELRHKLGQLRPSLSGCFFIGDVPYIQYQVEQDHGVLSNTTFPCDLYFMDLDGVWKDNLTSPGEKGEFTPGPDGIFDHHSGAIDPDIFVGRLPYYSYEDKLSAYRYVNQYLNKLIRYWEQPDGVKKKALSYINPSWTKREYERNYYPKLLETLRNAGFTYDYITKLTHPESFGTDDYIKRLGSGVYSFVHLWAHSGYNRHEFNHHIDKIYLDRIYSSRLSPVIYNLFCCSATRWTENPRVGCLGTAYLYAPESSALTLIGSTKVGSMWDPLMFHQLLAQSEPIGIAYKKWWKTRPRYNDTNVYTREEMHWNYGLTLFGDPLIRLVNNTDLYMKDSPEDDGSTPNRLEDTQYVFWESKDLWIRNKRDGSTEHQNPVYREGKPVYVYARIRNRGTSISKSGGYVTLRWSNAGITQSYDSYLGKNKVGDVTTGGLIGRVAIPPIEAGSSVVVCIPWFINNPKMYEKYTPLPWHYCMLAEVESIQDPIPEDKPESLRDYVKTYNNVAMKNIYQIDISDEDVGIISGTVSVHNPSSVRRAYSLSIESLVNEATFETNNLTSVAEVSLTPSRDLYKVLSDSKVDLNGVSPLHREQRLVAKSDEATIDNFSLAAGEQGLINVRFNFKEEVAESEGEYICRLIIKDRQTGGYIGGETYVIKKKPRPRFATLIEHMSVGGGIQLKAKPIGEPASYRWRDLQGELLHEGATITLSSPKGVKLEVEAMFDGVKGEAVYDEGQDIALGDNLNVYPNPVKDRVTVKTGSKDLLSLVIIPIAGGASYIYSVREIATLDVGDFPRGKYVFTLFNGEAVYGKQLILFE